MHIAMSASFTPIGVCLLAVASVVAAEPPVAVLRHDTTVLTVALPDAQTGYYRGPRFDWGGMVIQAEWHGHTCFTELKRPHDPLLHDHAAGACEEFGFSGPDGYDETPVGGRFLKIGVGALVRDTAKPYSFGHPYPIAEAAGWKVEPGESALRFVQDFTLDAHLAYHYEKTVTVRSDGFRIARRIEARGDRPIITTHYCHNMFAIDQQPIDGTWRMELGWDAVANHSAPSFTMTGRTLSLVGPVSRTVWTDFSWPVAPATTDLSLIHGASQTTIRIVTDAPPASMSFYAEATAICPEPFVNVRAEPGSACTWTTDYIFSGP